MGLVMLLKDKRVYLDTNVFIYALNGFPTYAPLLTELFDAIEAGDLVAVTSELALAEALVVPFRHGNVDEEQRCREIFRAEPGMELHPVSISVLEGMARLRGECPAIRTPDAIHATTARLAQCDVFLTNDAHLKAVPGLAVLLLSDMPENA
jgi:predicted nucleic acid-binding protein